jgi:hypothetical protein
VFHLPMERLVKRRANSFSRSLGQVDHPHLQVSHARRHFEPLHHATAWRRGVARIGPADAAVPLPNRTPVSRPSTRQPAAAGASGQSDHHGDTEVARRKHGETVDTSRRRRTPDAQEHKGNLPNKGQPDKQGPKQTTLPAPTRPHRPQPHHPLRAPSVPPSVSPWWLILRLSRGFLGERQTEPSALANVCQPPFCSSEQSPERILLSISSLYTSKTLCIKLHLYITPQPNILFFVYTS